MINRPPAATLIQSTIETSATSLRHTGGTRASSALVTLRRTVKVKMTAASRTYILNQKTGFAYSSRATVMTAGMPVSVSTLSPPISHGWALRASCFTG